MNKNHQYRSVANQQMQISRRELTADKKVDEGVELGKRMKSLLHKDGRNCGDQEITHLCEKLLEHHPKVAAEVDAVFPLWHAHYLDICSAEAALQRSPSAETRQAFDNSIQQTLSHLQRLYARVARYGNTSFGKKLLYKLLICTGDAERYRDRNSIPSQHEIYEHSQRVSVSCSFVPSIKSYTAAWRLLESYGQACNQLGVVFEQKGRVFETLYFYIRGHFASAKPFKKSLANFQSFVERKSSTVGVSPQIEFDDPLRTVDFLEESFLLLVAKTLGIGSVADDAVVSLQECFDQCMKFYVEKSGALYNSADKHFLRMVIISVAVVLLGSRADYTAALILETVLQSFVKILMATDVVSMTMTSPCAVAVSDIVAALTVGLCWLKSLKGNSELGAVANRVTKNCPATGLQPQVETFHSLPEDVELAGFGPLPRLGLCDVVVDANVGNETAWCERLYRFSRVI